MKNPLLKFVFVSSLIFSCTSCYRMPTDEDYVVVPTTNNPTITHERSSWTPAMKY